MDLTGLPKAKSLPRDLDQYTTFRVPTAKGLADAFTYTIYMNKDRTRYWIKRVVKETSEDGIPSWVSSTKRSPWGPTVTCPMASGAISGSAPSALSPNMMRIFFSAGIVLVGM